MIKKIQQMRDEENKQKKRKVEVLGYTKVYFRTIHELFPFTLNVHCNHYKEAEAYLSALHRTKFDLEKEIAKKEMIRDWSVIENHAKHTLNSF